jgi:hypothetical protein
MGNNNGRTQINDTNQNLLNRPETDVSLLVNDGPQVKKIFALKNPVYLKRNTLILERNSSNRNIFYIKFNYDSLVDMNVNIFIKSSRNKNNSSGAPYYIPVNNSEENIMRFFNLPRGQNREFFEQRASIDITQFSEQEEGIYDVVIEFIPIFTEDIRNQSEQSNLNGNSEIIFYTLCKVINDESSSKIKTEMQRLRSQGMWFDLYEVFNSALETGECLICCSNIRNTIFLPCKHSCSCQACSHSLRMRNSPCPICKICKFS